MSIEKDILAWDGKSADAIRAVFESHHKKTGFLQTIVRLAKDPSFQKGATWLLKAALESGQKLQKEQVKEIYGSLDSRAHWETKLHILQSVPYMPVEKDSVQHLYNFIRATLTDSKKFVRAWSYNGFYELAVQYPEYVNEAKQLFETAMNDEAASVKARIRNIVKKGF